ncbi:uncharacterized protein LOC134528163 isoform X2 [Bacillus rossius redtenbacheri]|uniref:uncharacterized protein LOC134528163 isoform X2 n=1 Tax=Bacillus rossius redtenbacheri TaxID=93214 RepID=UPI002FDD946D
MSRMGRGNKRVPDIPLLMECFDEDLSPHQLAAYNRCENEYQEITAKLENLGKTAEVIERISDQVYALQTATVGNAPLPAVNASAATPAVGITKNVNSPITRQQAALIGQPPPTIVSAQSNQQSGGVVTRGAAAGGNTYQLVMDPRLGLLVGTVTTQSQATTPVIQSTTSLAGKASSMATPPDAPLPRVQSQVASTPARTAMPLRTRTQVAMSQAAPTPQKQPASGPGAAKAGLVSLAPAAPVPRTRGKNVPITPKPAEGNSIGGLSLGGANKPKDPACAAPVVDLTNDDNPTTKTTSKQPVADSHEVTFSKLSGKTFPSLVVVARPNLRVKDIPQSVASQERTQLDSKVKNVLMFLATKFTEWLIQQGLVRSEQTCSIHYGTSSSRVRLKLGMYSDASKFPYSGGYVWISDCCPQRFVSVFHGSIFEGAPHPPTVLLKLIYHWCCQTNIQNVVQWVKVDNFYVKNFYSNMRSICTVAVHEKYEKMGGSRKKIEVGVISLGTTSQDGNMRQVKVEVLGVMDAENKLVRLRAIEPLQEGERNYKRRFVKILEPLENWVEKDSIILTDFTVDKGTLHTMGFTQVYQVSVADASSGNNKFSNQNVMEYLRRIVPRMFQNTLSLLSRQIIQQFLDELVWRERWGPIAAQAFDNIILHIAEQTKLDTGESLVTRLSRVSANPFKHWNYASFPPPSVQQPSGSMGSKADAGSKTPSAAAKNTSGTPQGDNQSVSTMEMLPQSIRDAQQAGGSAKRSRKRVAETPAAVAGPASKQPKRVATPPQTKAVVTPPPPEEQVCLDSYYYGSMEGDAEKIKNEFKNTLDIKCCVCHRKFVNNITLMKHLLMHVQSNSEFTTELSDLTQCKYCLKSFPTPFSMQTHMEEVHMKVTTTSLVCRICEEKFKDRMSLIGHMHKSHVATELPYECGVCRFRSSLHKDVVDHFYEVHNGGEKLQCPFCLKIVSIGNRGKKISANVNFYLNHMQKHQRKSITRKCNKCTLWFVHKGILKEHQIKDHTSFMGQTGTKPFSSNSDDVMMSRPAAYQNNQGRGPLVRKGSPKLRTSYNMKKFEEMKIVGVDPGSRCCECEGDMMGEDHFMGYLQCLRCQYSTCCGKAMAEHTVMFHDSLRTPQFSLGRVSQLPKEMFCVCGFKSSSGNKLANHLAHCKRKSAYPSPAHAKAATIQSASFPPLVTLDDAEENSSEDPSDRWLKAFVSRKDDSENSKDLPEKKQAPPAERADPPSMLNILGLVRKASTDDSSLDRAPSDTEGGATDSRPDAEKNMPVAGKSEESNNKNQEEMEIEIDVDVERIDDDDDDGPDFQPGGCTPDKDDKAFPGFDVVGSGSHKEADGLEKDLGVLSAFDQSSSGDKAGSSSPALDDDSVSSAAEVSNNVDAASVQQKVAGSPPRGKGLAEISDGKSAEACIELEEDRSSSPGATELETASSVSPLVQLGTDSNALLPTVRTENGYPSVAVPPVADGSEEQRLAPPEADCRPLGPMEMHCDDPPVEQLEAGSGGVDTAVTGPATSTADARPRLELGANSSELPPAHDTKGREPVAAGAGTVLQAEEQMEVDPEPSQHAPGSEWKHSGLLGSV